MWNISVSKCWHLLEKFQCICQPKKKKKNLEPYLSLFGSEAAIVWHLMDIFNLGYFQFDFLSSPLKNWDPSCVWSLWRFSGEFYICALALAWQLSNTLLLGNFLLSSCCVAPSKVNHISLCFTEPWATSWSLTKVNLCLFSVCQS